MARVNLSGVEKLYAKSAQKAVNDFSLDIPDGDFLCMLGPSGCGKTTTLRMIAGLEDLSAGEITIGDTVVDSVPDGVHVPPEKRNIGLVFQSYALWPHMTVKENVAFGLRLRQGRNGASHVDVVKSVMETLGIERFADRYPAELSGGQQQRVALARTLAVRPEVILLDEPLSNLDAKLRLEMRAELKRIHDEYGSTFIFVTHDQWEAMTLAKTIAVMSEGRLQQVGTPDDIYSKPANRFVAEFLGSPPINIVEMDGSSPFAQHIEEFVGRCADDASEVVSVGIRPEDCHISSVKSAVRDGELALDGAVGAVLPTGGSWIIEVFIRDFRLFATVGDLGELREGDEVTVSIRPKALHLFDSGGSRVDAIH